MTDTSKLNTSQSSRGKVHSGWCCSEDCLRKFRMLTSVEDLKSLRFWRAMVAEFVGTMLLVLVGCGSCVQWADGTIPNYQRVVQISICFGLSVATIIWIIGHVSGGHINPAVTCAMVVTRRISLARALGYIVFQCLGAIVGSGILKGVTPVALHGSLGATTPSKLMDGGKAFGVEFFITFVLVLTVFASCDKRRKDLNGSFPLTIGLSVTMCHLFAVEFTGASMNTARTFGPAVVTGVWDSHWIYWLGPILGGIVAGIVYDNVFAVNASLSKARGCLLTSEFDNDKYKAQKPKIRIIEEEDGEPEEAEKLNLERKDAEEAV